MLLLLVSLFTALVGWSVHAICDFQIVDVSKNYDGVSWKKPLLLKNAFKWEAKYADKQWIAETFSNVTVKMTKYVEHAAATGLPYDSFDVKFSDWMTAKKGDTVPGYAFNWCTGECAKALPQLPYPEVMGGSSKRYFYVIGDQKEGSPPHAHFSSWAAQLSGTKIWKAQWEEDPKLFCVAKQGDVVYVPDDWYHETMQKGWSFSYGAHGEGDNVTNGFGDLYGVEARTRQKLNEVRRAAVLGRTADLEDVRDHLTQDEIVHVLEIVSRLGHIEVVDKLLQKYDKPDEIDLKIFTEAGLFGQTSLCEWILKRNDDVIPRFQKVDKWSETFEGVVETNALDVAHLMLNAGDIKLSDRHVQLAFLNGHYSMLKLLLDRRADTSFFRAVATLAEADPQKNTQPPKLRHMLDLAPSLHLKLVKFLKNAAEGRKEL